MDQFRIRLCQFHNDHHEIQQDICIWNHQVYPKYNLKILNSMQKSWKIMKITMQHKNGIKSGAE